MFDKCNIDACATVLDKPNAMAGDGRLSHFDALMAVKPDDLTPNAWAVKAQVGRSIFANMRTHDNPTAETLERLLDAIGVSQAQYDAVRNPAPAVVGSELAPARTADLVHDYRPNGEPELRIPLLGSALGGEYGDLDEHIELTELDLGEPLDWLSRPPSLSRDTTAYALTVLGDSMAPAFEPGTRVLVSPLSSVSIGDTVVVQLRGRLGDDDRVRMVLIKRFVRRTAAGIELRQFNPDLIFQVPAARICTDGKGRAAIHKVTQALF